MTGRDAQLQTMIEGFHTLKRAADLRGHAAHAGRITTTQWIALGVIARAKTASIKEIREALMVSSSAATQLVNELVKSGQARRHSVRGDARITAVSLSPAGRKALRLLREGMVRHLSELFSVLTDREFAEYMKLHEKIIRKAASYDE